MAVPKQFLTQDDVCGTFQVSRTTLWRLVNRGHLRPARLRVGASSKCPRLRFDPKEIERYVRRCTTDAGKREASRLHPLERVRRDYDALTHDERQALLEFIRRDLDKGQP